MERISQWSRSAAVALTCSLACLAPLTLAAQTPDASLAVMDTTIQPGQVDFSRYDTPSACAQTAAIAADVARRADVDTAIYDPDHDTVSSNAVDIARRCGAKFTPANVAQRELLSLVHLSLLAGHDDVARAAADRWASLVTDPNEKGWAMYSTVAAYVSAHPSRFVEAERVVARMDSMGTAAIAPRINAHSLLLVDAGQRFDVPRIEREAVATLKIDGLLAGEERNDVLYGAGNALFDILWAELYRDPQHAVASVMQLAHSAGYRWATDTMTVKNYLTTIVTPIGHPPPGFTPKFWFGAHGTESWPVPGKVTMLLPEPSPGISGYRMYAIIRRLHKKYGDALNMTVMARTEGYIHDSSPLTPAQEADSLRSYYHDFLKLPVTVGVEEMPFQRLPDGRRVNTATAMDQIQLYGFGPLLVDQSGNLVILGERSQAALEAFIDKALHNSTVSSAK